MTEPPSRTPAPNPLVVTAENEDAEPLDSWAGAGVASSVEDLDDALGSPHADAFEIAVSAAAAGLDVLDAVADPLGSLGQAGIGWLIEHVWFLHEPLDALAGDPTRITAQARTWHNVGTTLSAVADEHRASATVPGWAGDAADAHRRSTHAFAATLATMAADAENLSALMLTTGAAVGTERALLRDRIAEFVTVVIECFFWSLACSLLTAGGALGAFAASVVVRAVELAESAARAVSVLLDALHAAGGTAAELSGALRDTAAQVRVLTPEVRDRAEALAVAADDVGAARAVESGKQSTGVAQDRRDWDRPTTGPAPG